MMWFKAFHLIFMVTWFAGLFYLPRLYVYHAGTNDALSHERFCVMERRLFVMMTLGGVLTLIFGALLLWQTPHWHAALWLHIKLGLIALLWLYHGWCWRLMWTFRNGHNRHSQRWYRYFNELPSLALVAIILLASLKPM